MKLLPLIGAILVSYSLPSELQGFSGSNPPPPTLQCGKYLVSLHITDEVENAMRVGYMFVDGRVVKGGYHGRGTYGTFHHPRNGNHTGEPDYATKDPWYYFQSNPTEGILRVLVLEDGTEIKCEPID